MEHTYKVSKKDQLILRKMRGIISLDDFKKILNEATNIEGYNPNYRVILDYRNTTFISNIHEFRSFLKLFKKSNYHNSTKLFIVNSPRGFVASRLFKDLLDFSDIYIFYTPIAALNHIGLYDTSILQFLETD